MADTYPLKRNGVAPYTGKSPSAVTDEAARYKEMLGFQAAGEDVGLFYQMNQVATSIAESATTSATNARSTGPVEAGGQYT